MHLYHCEWRWNADCPRFKSKTVTYYFRRYSNKNKSNLLTKAFISKAMLKIFSNIRLSKKYLYMKIESLLQAYNTE